MNCLRKNVPEATIYGEPEKQKILNTGKVLSVAFAFITCDRGKTL